MGFGDEKSAYTAKIVLSILCRSFIDFCRCLPCFFYDSLTVFSTNSYQINDQAFPIPQQTGTEALPQVFFTKKTSFPTQGIHTWQGFYQIEVCWYDITCYSPVVWFVRSQD